MRILLINYEYPPLGGGAASATWHLARQWVRQGHKVHLITSAFRDLPRQETQEGIEIERVPAARRRASGSTAVEQVTFALSGIVRIPFLVKRWRPDIACAIFAVPSGPVALLAKAVQRIPYVVSLQGMDVPGFPAPDVVRYHPWISPAVRLVLQYADGIVAVSDGLRDLIRRLAPRASIEVIPFGIDRAEFFPTSKSLPPGPFRLLFVGRLVKQKALPVLLEAVSRAHQAGVDIRLTVAGDGPERPMLEERAARDGLSGLVEFVGWRDRSEVPELYRRSHLFVLPSYTESFGQVMLEAMASGLPIVTTHPANMANLVAHEKNGLLVPAGDSQALAAVIERIATDERFRQSMGTESERRSQDYRWERVAGQYLDLFEDVLRQRGALVEDPRKFH